MKSKPAFFLFVLLTGFFSTAMEARAEAPVVDLSRAAVQDGASQGLEADQQEGPSVASQYSRRNESIDQRVQRLERQIANLTEMNFASRVEKIQQEMQQLHGQIEVQNHELVQMKEQLRNFYQDLDQRLGKLQPDDSKSGKSVLTAENSKGSKKDLDVTDELGSSTKELQTYETAFNFLNKKQYDKALEGFRGFVKNYPNSSYQVNAHYWLGEIYYLKGKSEQANEEFQAIIAHHPTSPKVADAMLKVALIAMDSGNYTKAKQNLVKVQKQFPNTTAAKVATLRLKEIKQKK